MAITITRPNKEINGSVIEHFETLIGQKLPADYRQFLLSFNGGKPENNEFAIPDKQNAAGVNLFYGLLENREWGDLIYQREMLLERVPVNVLPIGEASSGNAVCLSLQVDTYGQIFFWDHELEANEDEPATFANLFKIDGSFADFFERLRKFDASQVRLKPGQAKKVWVNPKFLDEQKKRGNVR